MTVATVVYRIKPKAGVIATGPVGQLLTNQLVIGV